MSIETLNLLSDSTFGDKLDEQNAILEEIRDNVGGGGSDLKTAAVRSDAPDSQGVSQFYKLDAQGNRTNVYPALSPVGSLNWVLPKIPSLASNTDDIFLSTGDNTYANPIINTNYILIGNTIRLGNSAFYLWIKNITFGITSNDDFYKLFTFIPQLILGGNNAGIAAINQSTQYLGYTVVNIYGNYVRDFKLLYG